MYHFYNWCYKAIVILTKPLVCFCLLQTLINKDCVQYTTETHNAKCILCLTLKSPLSLLMSVFLLLFPCLSHNSLEVHLIFLTTYCVKSLGRRYGWFWNLSFLATMYAFLHLQTSSYNIFNMRNICVCINAFQFWWSV